MDYVHYVRRPFEVDAVEITEDNIAEIAKLVGELKFKDDTTYIQLDRRIIPNVTKAYIGWFMTKLETDSGTNYRCYSPKAFHEQFIEHAPTIEFSFEGTADGIHHEPVGEPEDQQPAQPIFHDIVPNTNIVSNDDAQHTVNVNSQDTTA